MAEIKNGILGAFTGRIGPVSGYTRNGRNIMRSAASTVTDKVTDKRRAQRGYGCAMHLLMLFPARVSLQKRQVQLTTKQNSDL